VTQPEVARRDWLWQVVALAAGVVVVRWVLLGFSGIDLFVDETQYWLWGQDFAWGYYSKPPLIAWLIGAVTTLAGSDAPFWVRMPAPLLNGATAVLLAALSARVWGPRSAIWVAAAWLSLPAVALGSILISTDTVMAPLFAAALLVHHRLCETRRARDALLVGVLIGLALLAKYAAVYFLVGAGLAALLFPGARIGWRNAGLMLLALAIVVAPNLLWNLQNGLVTLRHTADNIGWVENGIDADRLPGFVGLVIFLASQLAVMGPVLFGAFVIALARFRSSGPLAAFALVPLAAVSVQSLLDTAYANWAVAAYFAGTPLAMAVLARYPRLRIAGLTINVAIALIVHLLAVWPQITLWQADPPLERYVGRAALSQELIALAKQDGDAPIYVESRDIAADLFYVGRDSGLTFYAPRANGRPMDYYQQNHPLPPAITGPLLVVRGQPTSCPDLAPPVPVGRGEGVYEDKGLMAHLIDGACLAQR
jgi:4-amino-4-deoxy-L-arabinose transferase-like glycosyltransferase